MTFHAQTCNRKAKRGKWVGRQLPAAIWASLRARGWARRMRVPGVFSGGGRARAKVGSRKKPQRRVPRPAGLDLVRRRQAQQDRLSSSRDGRSARISSSRGSSGSRSVGSESGERGASCGSTEMLLQQCAVWGKTKRNVFWHKRARTHRDEGSGALKAGGRPSRSCSQAGRARPHSREPGGGRQQHAQHVSHAKRIVLFLPPPHR